MPSRRSARIFGRSPVESATLVSTASSRSRMRHTSYFGRRRLIHALLLREDTRKLDPPVIRACRSFLE